MYPDDSLIESASAGGSVVVALLGGIAIRRDDGALLALPGARARSLLVALAAHTGRVRGSRALIEDVWGDQLPRAPMNALHTQMSRLRSVLPDGAIEMSAAGYRLALSKYEVDLWLAGALEQRAQRQQAEGEHAECLATVALARALWRGEPGADLPAGEPARELIDAAQARLTALDTVAVAAHLALGDAEAAVAPARAVTRRRRLDEGAHLDLMRALAVAGRPNEALEVFAALRTRLVEELGTEPGPALVGMNTAVLRGQALAPRSAPPATRAPAGNGLRVAPNPLLGRDTDLDALDVLARTTRVTTILGPGGIGKTRVAHELGRRWTDRMRVALVELATVRSGGDLLGAIGSVLGIGDVERVRPTGIAAARVVSPQLRLREALDARPTLLILDNCEHLIEHVAELVAELIGGCDQLRVVTTSRAPLMITAEAVYPLAPLRIDENGSPATDLFVARARAVRPSARLEMATVAELCRTLDGLPLAIELAAARVRSLSLDEVRAGLASRFALLRGGDRTSPARHRTLHAVIDWSWSLLDPAQRAALRRLSRFPAGFTAAAAVAVAGWGVVSDLDDALDGLVNQSLLVVVESPQTGAVRYRMLETVREFGEHQLRAAGEDDAVVARMADWARELTLALAPDAVGERQAAVAHTLSDEQDNLLAVLRETASRPPEPDVEATFCLVFTALAVLWMMRSRNFEVVPWAARILRLDHTRLDLPFDAIAAATMLAGANLVFASGVRSAMVARLRLRQLLAARTDGSPLMRFQARAATTPLHGRRLPRLLSDHARSADEATVVAALLLRANVYENLGNMRGSLHDGRRALAIAERRKDLFNTSMICQHMASIYGQTARYAESVDYYRRAVDGLRQLLAFEEADQHSCWLINSLVGMGDIAMARQIVDRLRASHLWLDDLDADDPTGPGGEAGEQLALMAVAVAELGLADGDTARGLANYRRALRISNWPRSGQQPGPFGMLLAAGAVCAYAAADRAVEATGLVAEIVTAAPVQLSRFPDYPQVGLAAVAVAAHGMRTGADPATCIDLLALAAKVCARQDFPSLCRGPLLATAGNLVGQDALDTAIRRAAAATRRAALNTILTHIETLYPAT